MKAYIHSTLSMEYGREGDKPSELQLAFHHLQAELAKGRRFQSCYYRGGHLASFARD